MGWCLLVEDPHSTSRWLPMRYAIRLRNFSAHFFAHFSAHCLLLSSHCLLVQITR